METLSPEPTTDLAVFADTGPLISALQSNSMPLLAVMFGTVYVSTTCLDELAEHGWGDALRQYYGGVVRVEPLTEVERERAAEYALRIARQQPSGDDEPRHHLGEAEVMVLSERDTAARTLVLLDELAARAIAQALGLNVSGFAGVLLVAAREGLITSQELRQHLRSCRDQGTHYSNAFIERVYRAAQERVD